MCESVTLKKKPCKCLNKKKDFITEKCQPASDNAGLPQSFSL